MCLVRTYGAQRQLCLVAFKATASDTSAGRLVALRDFLRAPRCRRPRQFTLQSPTTGSSASRPRFASPALCPSTSAQPCFWPSTVSTLPAFLASPRPPRWLPLLSPLSLWPPPHPRPGRRRWRLLAVGVGVKHGIAGQDRTRPERFASYADTAARLSWQSKARSRLAALLRSAAPAPRSRDKTRAVGVVPDPRPHHTTPGQSGRVSQSCVRTLDFDEGGARAGCELQVKIRIRDGSESEGRWMDAAVETWSARYR